MKSLLQSIKNNNQAYNVFVLQWNSNGNNKGTGTQFSGHYAKLRPTQDKVTLEAKNLIEKQLDFLPEFSQLLKCLIEMQANLQNQIQSKAKYGCNLIGTGTQFAALLQNILNIGKQIQIKAQFLNENWDIEFLKKLYRSGMSIQSIIKIRDENIRQEIVKYLTDQDIQSLGIKKIGDLIILKKLR